MIGDAPPKIWLPPRPAIMRPADAALLRAKHIASDQARDAISFLVGLPGWPVIGQASISHVDYQGITTNLTTYTFSSLSFGAAAADRYLAAFVAGRLSSGSTGVSSVTIGGVTATSVISRYVEGDTGFGSSGGIYIAAVPTGTSGNVVVTFNGEQQRAAVALYRLVGLGSSTAAATADGSVSGTGNSGDKTLQIYIPGQGVMMAGAAGFGTQNSFSAAGMTTDFTNTTIESSYRMSAGHGNYGSAQTALTVTCNLASSFRELLFLAASWSP